MAILKNVLLGAGLILILIALVSKAAIGVVFGMKPLSYLIAANTCFLLSLIVVEKK